MDRIESLAILKKMAPALSSRDLIPVFSCFCFGEGMAFAYDDIVAIQFPAEFGIRGAIRGQLLLGFLAGCKTKEVIVQQGGANVVLKGGRSTIKTTALPETDFLFTLPNVKKATAFKLDAKFLGGLQRASVSIGRDPSHTTRLGVTIVFTEGGTRFYATDNKTAAKVTVGKPADGGTPVVLPPRFVELMESIGKGDPAITLFVTTEWVEVRFRSGLRLFSRTINGSDLAMFKEVFAKKPDVMIDLPKGFGQCLERALVVLPYTKNPFTEISVGDAMKDGQAQGKIRFSTKSTAGNVTDSVALDSAKHPEVTAEFPPDLILKGLAPATSVGIMENRMVLSGKGYSFLVSSVQKVTDGEEKQED